MKRNVLIGIGLTCVGLLVTAESAQAQLFRGGRGNFGGGYVPNANYGYANSPYYGNYGGYGGNYGNGWGWNQGQGWYGQPYGTNYSQGYTNNTMPRYYGDGYTGYQSGNAGFYTSAPNNTQTQSSFYAGPGGQDNNHALLRVLVPAPNARIWIEGKEMQQQGTPEHVFISPPLERGSHYVYNVRASWDENGRQVTHERKVPVTAGQQVTANFMEGDQSQQHQDNNQQRNRQQLQNQSDTSQPQAQPADQRSRPAASPTPAPKQ
jgi:uncharacterized protein (TIGR03000 family)